MWQDEIHKSSSQPFFHMWPHPWQITVRLEPTWKQLERHTQTKTWNRQHKRNRWAAAQMTATNERVFSSAQGAAIWLREPNEYVYSLSSGMAGSRLCCWWAMRCLRGERKRYTITFNCSEKSSRITQTGGSLAFLDYISNKFGIHGKAAHPAEES